ncbi:MAG: tyrosine-type recombinase/integrase [Kiritimatiellae bacterium]|nr:tyrosine-type recombinase/integrase [Kiritimatiellia bacterium]
MNNIVTKHRTGYLYRRGSSGVYYLEYMMGGIRVKKALHNPNGTPITNRRDAETERARIMSPLTVAEPKEARALSQPSPAGQATGDTGTRSLAIDDVWKTYKESQTRPDSGDRTLDGYQSQFHLFADWLKQHDPKCKHLAQVTPTIAEEYASYLQNDGNYPKSHRTKKRKSAEEAQQEEPTPKKAFSMNTFNKHIRLLELVCRVLQGKAGLAQNPWSSIMRRREDKKGRRELTVDEINTVVNSATGEIKTLLILGVYTGLRLGDACTLRWSEVDFARHIILRVPNKTARRKNEPVHIPIHPTLMDVLSQTPKNNRKGYVFPETAMQYERNSSDVSKILRTHFKSCGLQVHAEGTGKGTSERAVVEVGFHSLRHSFVSLCREANAPLAVVEAIVGHSNPAMTRHYTHIGDLAAAQAVAALPPLLGPVGKSALKHEPRTLPAVDVIANIRQVISAMTPKSCLNDKRRILNLIQEYTPRQV